jgi:hypothetical protein
MSCFVNFKKGFHEFVLIYKKNKPSRIFITTPHCKGVKLKIGCYQTICNVRLKSAMLFKQASKSYQTNVFPVKKVMS